MSRAATDVSLRQLAFERIIPALILEDRITLSADKDSQRNKSLCQSCQFTFPLSAL